MDSSPHVRPRDSAGVAARILLDLGAGSEKIRSAFIRVTRTPPTDTTPFPSLDASSPEDLDDLIDQLVVEELEGSFRVTAAVAGLPRATRPR